MDEYLFPVGAFVFFWLFGGVIVFFSDWRFLAEKYAADRKPHGKYFYFQSINIGNFRFGGMITIGASREGLYLAMIFLYRPIYKSMLIPWEDFSVECIKWKFLCFKSRAYVLKLCNDLNDTVSIGITGKTFEKIIEYMEKNESIIIPVEEQIVEII